MKRNDILFRGWSNDRKGWVYGSLFLEMNGKSWIILRTGILGSEDIHTVLEWVEVDSKLVGQFTGLFDVDGNRIFEGDVLVEQNRWPYFVEFNDGSFRLVPVNLVQRVNWVHFPLTREDACRKRIVDHIYNIKDPDEWVNINM